jgi:hypothetical protein
MDGRRLLQIVLVGQPALIETLRSDSMRALADRISRRMSLGSLPDADVAAYIRHRLTIAGGKDAVSFDADALARIADLSDGLPRRINLLCDRALELGRAAGVTTISAAIVSNAARAIAGASTAVESVAPAPKMLRASADAPRDLDADATHLLTREPVSDDMFKELDLLSTDGPIEAFDRPLSLIIDTPPPKSNLRFWLMVLVLAGAGAAAGYFAYRFGWVKL